MTRRPPAAPTWTLANLGLWGLVRRVAAAINNNNMTGYSAELAYYFFLSLFPSLLALTALLAYLPIPHRNAVILGLLGRALPKQALALVQGNFRDLLHQQKGGLLSFGIVFALVSASSAVTTVSTALNHAYGIPESRPFWRLWGTALILVLGLALLLLIAITLFFFGPKLVAIAAGAFHWGLLPVALAVIRWPVLLAALIIATALVYHFTPSIHHSWRWLTPGAIVAIAGWIGISALFAFYVNHFGSYNKTYGSIGAVIVLLTWMYLSGLVLLVGGEINAIIARTGESPPTTAGPPVPPHLPTAPRAGEGTTPPAQPPPARL